jgi:hypothetical protein
LAVFCSGFSHFGSGDCLLVWLVEGLTRSWSFSRLKRKYNFPLWPLLGARKISVRRRGPSH